MNVQFFVFGLVIDAAILGLSFYWFKKGNWTLFILCFCVGGFCFYINVIGLVNFK